MSSLAMTRAPSVTASPPYLVHRARPHELGFLRVIHHRRARASVEARGGLGAIGLRDVGREGAEPGHQMIAHRLLEGADRAAHDRAVRDDIALRAGDDLPHREHRGVLGRDLACDEGLHAEQDIGGGR